VTYRKAVSLFSNCGAGDLGYREAGFRFQVMAELDPRRLAVSLLNHPGATGIPEDLRDTWPQVVEAYRSTSGRKRPALLSACPPCQGMSSANGDRGAGDDPDASSKDKRNLLVAVVADVALALKSKLVVLENVQEFLTRKVRHPVTGAVDSAARLLTAALESDYQVFPILTDLADYGVPQTRKRAFLTFVRRDVPGLRRLLDEGLAPYPLPTHAADYEGQDPVSISRALRSFRLRRLDAGSAKKAAAANPMHAVPVWPDRQYRMVSAIPPNSGASAWENDACPECGHTNARRDMAVCASCNSPLLRPIVREKEGSYRLVKGFHNSSYRRMHPDAPASTITTASGHVGSDFTIHPSENRLLSPLECALLQTFPHNFKWGDALEEWGATNVRAMIGEAVPPQFTRLHGDVLMALLRDEWDLPLIPLDDPRCDNARRKLNPVPRPAPAQAGEGGEAGLRAAGGDLR
jgi:DNA (cytosine-5)-methyltransferase 1